LKHRFLDALGLSFLLAVIGCSGGPPDRKVGPSGTGPPRRIVSMTPALTEILFALGVGERVVGVTEFCDYPPEAARAARIGGYANPSVEAILSLHPDLTLVSPGPGNRDAALAVERAGVRLEVVPAETLSETYRAIVGVARACGVEERGRDLANSIRSRIAAAAERVRDLPKVRTLFCVQIDPLIAVGRGTLPGEILELAGGVNVIESARYPQVGIETVLAAAPQVILHARMDSADPAAGQLAMDYWSRWQAVPAVRDQRVVVFDATIALRPGPRVADAVERLATMLHGTPPAVPVRKGR